MKKGESNINVRTLLWRGYGKCCPQCGSPGLFLGYLKIANKCSSCGLDFSGIRSDDIPAYFTIAIVGHIILPLISIAEIQYYWPLWLHMAIWPLATIVLTLLFLPRIKGIVMAILWKVKQG